MSAIRSEVWSRLQQSPPTGQDLTARTAVPDLTERLLCAIDAEGLRHLLVPLMPAEESLQDLQSRGLTVKTDELNVRGSEPARYIDIACHDAAGYDAFDLIGGELAGALTLRMWSPAEVVARILTKWRRFWGHLPSAMLSREEQLGLFAELWFLSMWLVPCVGPVAAVERWRGPFGARHDFEWQGCSVEVKETTSTRGAIHRVNGIDQLVLPDDGELFLFSLRLREEGGASNTLPTLVESCRQQLAEHDETSCRFESALLHLGYSPAHEEEYARVRLRMAGQGLYVVRDDFPRLTASQFSAGVPAGIERVDYEINLAGFERLRVAERPSDLSMANW